MKRHFPFLFFLLFLTLGIGCKRDGAQQADDKTAADSTAANKSGIKIDTISDNPNGDQPGFTPADPKGYDANAPHLIGKGVAEAPAEANPQLELAMRKLFKPEELAVIKGEGSKYIFGKVDLNNDKNLEYIVGLKGPQFCSQNECKVMIFRQIGVNQLELIGTVDNVLLPPYFSYNDRRNEWSNMIVQNNKGEFRVFSFDGEKYVQNAQGPSGNQEVYLGISIGGSPEFMFVK